MKIKAFWDPFPGREGIYLFTTEHQLRQLVFRKWEDFAYGVNTLAIATLKYKVKILCYTLMDNHLHLLLKGRYEDCQALFRWVLHRLAQMLNAHYGINGFLKVEAADIQVVTDSGMLLNEVAYLLRNAYKARINSPYSYPWNGNTGMGQSSTSVLSTTAMWKKPLGAACPCLTGCVNMIWSQSWHRHTELKNN